MSHKSIRATFVASVLLLACVSASAASNGVAGKGGQDVCTFDASFHDCLSRNASAVVKQPADRASQVFQVALALADGTQKTVTVLSTRDGTLADARRLAVEGQPGATLKDVALDSGPRTDGALVERHAVKTP